MHQRVDPHQATEQALTRASSARQELLALLRRDAYKEGKFKLASGRESNFLIDCKQVILTGIGHRLVGEALCGVLVVLPKSTGEPFQAIAGVALGGCPLASAASSTSAYHHLGPEQKGWNALYVRKAPKDHGTEQLIEGFAPAGCEVVLLEDVATTAGSAITAVNNLRAAGFIVRNVVAIVDRQEGAKAACEAAGLNLFALFGRDDFITPVDPNAPVT